MNSGYSFSLRRLRRTAACALLCACICGISGTRADAAASGLFPESDPVSVPAAVYTAATDSEEMNKTYEEPDYTGADAYQPAKYRFQPGFAALKAKGVPVPPHTLQVLKTALLPILRSYDGEWSVYVVDLENQKGLLIHDEAIPSASILKLFILGCVYDAIETGKLTRTAELVDLMARMIRVSSNDAANRLIALLGDEDYVKGVKAVNDYIIANGYSEKTRLYNPFQDESLKIDPNHTNHVSARDCGLFLERVYHRTLGSRKVCNEIEQWMLEQENRSKIPAGLPEGTSVGNKTGETDTIESDTAVVYSPGGDYIVCILSTGWEAKDTAIYRIRDLSAEIYDYFTDPDYAEKQFPLLAEH